MWNSPNADSSLATMCRTTLSMIVVLLIAGTGRAEDAQEASPRDLLFEAWDELAERCRWVNYDAFQTRRGNLRCRWSEVENLAARLGDLPEFVPERLDEALSEFAEHFVGSGSEPVDESPAYTIALRGQHRRWSPRGPAGEGPYVYLDAPVASAVVARLGPGSRSIVNLTPPYPPGSPGVLYPRPGVLMDYTGWERIFTDAKGLRTAVESQVASLGAVDRGEPLVEFEHRSQAAQDGIAVRGSAQHAAEYAYLPISSRREVIRGDKVVRRAWKWLKYDARALPLPGAVLELQSARVPARKPGEPDMAQVDISLTRTSSVAYAENGQRDDIKLRLTASTRIEDRTAGRPMDAKVSEPSTWPSHWREMFVADSSLANAVTASGDHRADQAGPPVPAHTAEPSEGDFGMLWLFGGATPVLGLLFLVFRRRRNSRPEPAARRDRGERRRA